MHDLLDETKQVRGIIADVNNRYADEGLTPLHMAVEARAPEIMRILLKFYAELNAQDIAGLTPLHIACGQNYLTEM